MRMDRMVIKLVIPCYHYLRRDDVFKRILGHTFKQFKEQMKIIVDMGLHERTAILAGIIVPKSLGMLKYMDSAVAGVSVPHRLWIG